MGKAKVILKNARGRITDDQLIPQFRMINTEIAHLVLLRCVALFQNKAEDLFAFFEYRYQTKVKTFFWRSSFSQ